ncbi:hypothetical protein D3C76_1240000 [compost metagenome]
MLVEPDLALVAEEADPVGQVLQGRAVLRRLVIDFHCIAPLVVLVRGGGRTTVQADGCEASTGWPAYARTGRALFLSGLKAGEKSIAVADWRFDQAAFQRLSKW